ncbi:gliding motility-associated C-terminal domain-containing protein [Edaphocola aurantiacus]|uniref:gliding motility-associated C-terminal domain-containing protein n=1 Tax=Edaphocola aurantiacus TaxID=2601682 RepID=UPI001C95DE46|nr:gliding motility-associated C-terminal domain-containing protein [Edaphocola aurantiacus]
MDYRYCIYLILIITSLFHTGKGFAQGENNHWVFGAGDHIDFNANPPTYLQNTNMQTIESAATVSDAQGNLLFYTIGCRIWDRNGNEMPNATGLKGNGPYFNGQGYGSGQDCVQTLPNPANPDQYYVFSGSPIEDGSDTIFYHIVDMTLNNGLGDVVASSKNSVLYGSGNLLEMSAITYGPCNSYWFVFATSTQNNCQLHACLVSETGIGTPVSSPMIIGFSYIRSLKISDNNPLAYGVVLGNIIRAAFDHNSGQFSNFGIIPNAPSGFALELSPDWNSLYLSGISNQAIRQYNVQLYPNLAAIGSSAVPLLTGITNPSVAGNAAYDIRLGPDNKVYFVNYVYNPATGYSEYLARIEQPNLPGMAATLNPTYTPFLSGLANYQNFKLSTQSLTRRNRDTITSNDSTIHRLALYCAGDSLVLSGTHSNIVYSEWDNGDTTAQNTVYQPGVYWLRSYSSNCLLYIDTFIVTMKEAPQLLGADTTICYGDLYTLKTKDLHADAYLWSNGSTAPSITITEAGSYHVRVQIRNCFFSDTINISTINPEIDLLHEDTLICKGSNVLLDAVSTIGDVIHWSTGQTGPSIYINSAGIYKAYTENKCGIQADSVRITDMDCDCRPIVPNAFTPNGDGRNDIFMPVFNPDCDALYYELKVYNRYGQLVYMTNRKGTGWDGTYASDLRPADAGVYFYTVKLSNRYGDTDAKFLKGDILLVR